MNPIAKAYWIAKGVGWDNVPRRLGQAFMLRSGFLKQRLAPEEYAYPHSLDDDLLRSNWHQRKRRFFRVPDAAVLRELVSEDAWQQNVVAVCERALQGQYSFFSHSEYELGWPPNFNVDPVNQIDWPVGQSWLETARSGPPRNDIKLVWEASRFTLAFFFSRAFAYSNDEEEKTKWAEAFWQLTEAWVEQNPVNNSVAWGCGQETAFRLMAILTGCMTMLENERTSAARLAKVTQLCWQFGKRIAANINYAISQENNHALSEALGLFTVGILFPEFGESERWTTTGNSILESEARRQIYDDGSYVQHSMSYHRVMLDDLSWVVGLARLNQREFSPTLMRKFSAAAQWMDEFINDDAGRVPNYGANDGANVLPLSCSDYLDYRPCVQAAAALCGVRVHTDERGPWSEKALWLTGRLPEIRPARNRDTSWHAPLGGYFLQRGPDSQLMTRATKFRDRPSQCDMLHVDLWFHGHNILRDAGSFRYYHESPEVKKFFYSAEAHNTIQVADTEQMEKGPNFLWFRWPIATGHFVAENQLECQARFNVKPAYSHRRRIVRDKDNYSIEDSVDTSRPFTLRWRLAPEFAWTQSGEFDFTTRIDDQEFRICFQSREPIAPTLTSTWESLYYGKRTQVPAIVVPCLTQTITTVVGPV